MEEHTVEDSAPSKTGETWRIHCGCGRQIVGEDRRDAMARWRQHNRGTYAADAEWRRKAAS